LRTTSEGDLTKAEIKGVMCVRWIFAITLPLALALTIASASEPKIAIFDFEMVDTSLDGAANGPRADEAARLVRLSADLRQRLVQSGRFEVIDIGTVAAQARASNLQACGGCDAGFAHELGAKYSVTGWIQKVSNLILNLNIVMREAETGKVIWARSVDMRGNTDESWSRALDYLVRNYLLAPGQGAF
jgi:TolB-like protein